VAVINSTSSMPASAARLSTSSMIMPRTSGSGIEGTGTLRSSTRMVILLSAVSRAASG
jgi:hypothetical protein